MTATDLMTVYTVRACAETGEWLDEPEATDERATHEDWMSRADTDAMIHDAYVNFADDHGDGETRLVCVWWVS